MELTAQQEKEFEKDWELRKEWIKGFLVKYRELATYLASTPLKTNSPAHYSVICQHFDTASLWAKEALSTMPLGDESLN